MMARITPAARIPIPNAGPENSAPTIGIFDMILPTGSEVNGEQRRKDKQAPHAVNDTWNGCQQLNGDTQRAFQPAGRKLSQEQGDTETHRDGDQQRDKRSHQRTVDRHQRPVDIVRCIPLFGPQESQTKFLNARPEEMIRETIMPPNINSTISAASFTSTLKIMSPFLPGGLKAGLVAAISYSSVKRVYKVIL